jgi:hypothetical protein
VDALFHATHLDRNQIIRGDLFSAAHSKEFLALLKPYQKDDVLLPSPLWSLEQDGFWLEQCPKTREGGKDVNAELTGAGETKKDTGVTDRPTTGIEKHYRRVKPIERTGREIPSSQPIKVQGGVVFTLN